VCSKLRRLLSLKGKFTTPVNNRPRKSRISNRARKGAAFADLGCKRAASRGAGPEEIPERASGNARLLEAGDLKPGLRENLAARAGQRGLPGLHPYG
jgi:hypothetical protein